jgi:hypothetical protein
LRTNFVLIDYESVQPSDLSLLDGEHFRALVFVGPDQPRVPIEFALALQKMGDRADYIRISGSGKVGLDLHVAFHIGQLASRHRHAFFHVISRDTGFDPLIEHLKRKRLLACRSACIADMPILRAANGAPDGDWTSLVITDLQRRGPARPRTLKSLLSMVQALAPNPLSDDELSKVFDDLVERGVVAIDGDKLRYQLGVRAARARAA